MAGKETSDQAGIKCFVEVHIDDNSCFSLIHQCGNPIVKATKLGRHDLPLVKP